MQIYLLILLTVFTLSLSAMEEESDTENALVTKIEKLDKKKEFKADSIKRIFSMLGEIYTYDTNNQLQQILDDEQIKNVRSSMHQLWLTLGPDEKAHPVLIPISLIMDICYGNHLINHLIYVEKRESIELRNACKIQNIEISSMLAKKKQTMLELRKKHKSLAGEKISLQKRLAEIQKESEQAICCEKQTRHETQILYGLRAFMKNATLEIDLDTKEKIKDIEQDIIKLGKEIGTTENQETKKELSHQQELLEQKLQELKLDSQKIDSRLKSTRDTFTGTVEQLTDSLWTGRFGLPGDRTRFLQGWDDYWGNAEKQNN